MILSELKDAGLIHPPSWLITNTQYLTVMGSTAYGVSNDFSDMDIYGFAIPPKEDIFPHLKGEILGFGRQKQRFDQWSEIHIAHKEKLYDFQVFGIVKLFHLCMENNPNMIDCLFTPQNCVLHITKIGNHVRDNRRAFLHKGAWHRFKGYAYSQLHKIGLKNATGKRAELIEKYGYDTKFAYHVVRLLGEVEQIMVEGDLDLQRNREQLKAIRKGEWTEDFLRKWAADKEAQLEKVYLESKLPHSPDEEAIKKILLECLEIQYGNLDRAIVQEDRCIVALRNIRGEIDKISKLI